MEVAKVDLGLNITVFRHTATWKKARNEQQNFIRSQDYLTRRCIRLYEDEDTVSQHSQSSSQSVNGHHVGVVYAPPFRPFMFGRVEDKSVLHDSYARETPTGRYRGYSNPGSLTSLHSTENIFSGSEEEQCDYERDEEIHSVRSSTSRDNDSFHTAIGSDEEDDYSIPDNYSVASQSYDGYTSDASSSNEQYLEDQREQHDKREAENNLTSAIPPSIPYSDYLRRYKVSRANSEFNHHGSFFHSYIPPSGPNFIPEKVSDSSTREYKCRFFIDTLLGI